MEIAPRSNQIQFGEVRTSAALRYFSYNDARLVASRILESDVKVAVYFDFDRDDATSESEPLVFNPIRPARQLKTSNRGTT